MSNKMLWKRLLATGMSMAMAATLFATNSITIFAEEGDPIEVISVAPAADAATEESTNEPQVSPTDGLPAPEVEEYVDNFPPFEDQEDYQEIPGRSSEETHRNCDGTKHTDSYSEVTVIKNEYYSDFEMDYYNII